MSGFFSKFYLKSELSSGVISLYMNRVILQVANGMLGLFLPVFLYLIYDQNIYYVIYYFLFGYLAYFFTCPIGARVMSKINLKRTLIISIPFLVLHYVCFYYFESSILIFSVASLLFLTVFRMFYWVPYHTDFAEFTDRRNRGKQISFLAAIASLVSIAVPFAGGFILDQFDFKILFVVVILLISVSVIPFLLTRSVYEKYSFGYWETFKKLFDKKNRRMLLAYGADGAENSVGVVLWPIFVWQILDGKYLMIGIISSVVVLITIIVQLSMGKFTDQMRKKKLMRTGSILYALGWLIKAFVSTGFQVFIASTYHSFATIVMRTPFDALMYEKAADSGHYVDEYTVLREMAISLGRVIILGFILVVIALGGMKLAFPLAALISLFINVL
jgi:MFS family permease